ncbi:MAG: tRNA lysidine(34) synthetase TilS [Acidimicrobiales bacterium]
MTPDDRGLLEDCAFPPADTAVVLAVSGGPDSLGLLLLALAAGLRVEVHHVDHHARPTSSDDASYVRQVCEKLAVPCVIHDVVVEPGANFEARARAERRAVLPEGSLTGHTMDDLVETVLLNMVRGAGIDGLSPMVNDPTKPLRGVRRAPLHLFVEASNFVALHDETNDDLTFRRNRVRHQLLPLMCEVAERDVVPIIARQAGVLFEERAWLDDLASNDVTLELADADCRELRRWPRARLRRWLRLKLFVLDEVGERHPPSAAEIERALSVVVGDVVATELSGGRRLSRRGQHLSLEDGSTTLTKHG